VNDYPRAARLLGNVIELMTFFILLLAIPIMVFYIAKINQGEARSKAELRYIALVYKLADLVIKEDKIRDPKKIMDIYEQAEKDIAEYRAKRK
jgi:hypothetical protein